MSDVRPTVRTGRSSAAKPRRRRGPGRPTRTLSRPEVVEAALTVAHRRGLDQLTVKDVAEELGITPTAVLWYVRTKKDLIEAIVDVALRHLAPPKRGKGSWTTELLCVFEALRHEMLANRRLLATTVFGQGAPLAFARIGLAGAQILDDAGFSRNDLRRAVQTLVRHSAGLTAIEMAFDAACESPRGRAFGLRQGVAKLSPDDFRLFSRTVVDRGSFDADELFTCGLGWLVRGLERQLERQTGRRGATGTKQRPGQARRRTRPTTSSRDA